jgi:hypothetical protein
LDENNVMTNPKVTKQELLDQVKKYYDETTGDIYEAWRSVED